MGTMYGIIEQLCSKRGIKPGKLCSDLGISRGILSDLKTGRTKKLSSENVAKISAYFGVSTDYLHGNDNDTRSLEKAKNELSEFVSDQPDVSSGLRLELLFNSSGYDHVVVCFNLGIDQSYLDSWMNANELPPKPIIDKILGVFCLKPEDLLPSNELADYNNEAQEWGTAEKAPTANSERTEKQDINTLRLAGRDGSYHERTLTDDQLAALKAILNQMPDASEDI